MHSDATGTGLRPGRPRRTHGEHHDRHQDRHSTAEVVRITDAAESLDADIARRSRRYLIQMSIRVVCFLGAVMVDHWIRWVLVAGAVVLPYIAVVLANAGRERSPDPGTLLSGPALPPAPPNGPPS